MKKEVQIELRKIGPNLRSASRKGLVICGDRQSEEKLNKLWNNLLDEGLQKSLVASPITYRHMYGKNERCRQMSIFNLLFTLGSSTNQSSESWHSIYQIFKKFDGLDIYDWFSFFSMQTSLNSWEQIRESVAVSRSFTPVWHSMSVIYEDIAVNSELSAYALFELKFEVSAAQKLVGRNLSFSDQNPLNVTVKYLYR